MKPVTHTIQQLMAHPHINVVHNINAPQDCNIALVREQVDRDVPILDAKGEPTGTFKKIKVPSDKVLEFHINFGKAVSVERNDHNSKLAQHTESTWEVVDPVTTTEEPSK